MNTEKLYILLPVHNRVEITARFISCLKKQTFQNYHLVIIDDGSKDGTSEMVADNISSLTVIRGKGSWWWGGSLHQGFKWVVKNRMVSDDDFVMINNDDTIFGDDFISNAVSVLKKNNGALLGSIAYSSKSGELVDSGINVDWKKYSFSIANCVEDINCLSTRGLFTRVKDFKHIGGFHPYLLPHYGSDYEFTIRARRKGFKLIVDNSVSLFDDDTTTGYRGGAELSFYSYFKKYFSRRSVSNPFMRTSLVLLACPWKWKLKNILRVWYITYKDFYNYFKIKNK